MRGKLGWGAFCTVWRCRDAASRQGVAVKVLQSNVEVREMARDEVKLLQRVKEVGAEHPGSEAVVRLLHNFLVVGPNGAHPCLVLELLGPDLLQCLRATGDMGLCLDNVKLVMRQVLQGLDFLHSQAGIIHTDIKPENVLLAGALHCPDLRKLSSKVPGLRVKLADLGSACWVDKQFSEMIGTRQYRGPEVLLGATYGPPVDVWAAACLAWELAVGSFLFQPRHSTKSRDAEHLAGITRLLGPLPTALVRRGKRCQQLYTNSGKLLHFPASALQPRTLQHELRVKFSWD